MFVLETERLIASAITSGFQPRFVLHQPKFLNSQLEDFKKANIPCIPVSTSLLKSLSSVETPVGLIAVFPFPVLPFPSSFQTCIVLDAVREPGNLGTIIRSALGSGVDLVILAPECADLFNPKVIRAAAGAHFRIPIHKLNWNKISDLLVNKNVYLADSSEGKDYTSINSFCSPWALIVSNEAHGPCESAKKIAHERLRISLANELDSLNVAIAASIILFEASRQMKQFSSDRTPNL